MGVWPRLHAALAVALVPLLVVAPAVGAGALAAWAALARPRRRAGSRDVALVLLAVVAAVALVHGRTWLDLVGPVLGAAALAAVVVRLDAAARRDAGVALGQGAAATALGVAGAALAEALANGFGQVATASFHPNAAAAMALGLAASSALALRGDGLERTLGGTGIAASLGLVVLTGSRGGVVGVAVAVAALAVLALARALARTGRTLGAVRAAAVALLALLVGTQTLLLGTDRWSLLLPADALNAVGAAGDAAVFERLALLGDPLATSGGRVGAWTFARELAAHRPFLGYGMAAIEQVYAPAASAELANPLAHPHHGVLTMVLQGGALFAVAVLALLLHLAGRLVRAAAHGDVAAGIAVAALAGLMAAEMLDAVARFGQVGGPMLLALVVAAATTTAADPTSEAASPEPLT